MKKIILGLVAVCSLLFGGIAIGESINGSFNGNPIVKVFNDGKVLTDEVPAQIIDGKTMVPLTMIRNLGFDVTWNADDYSVQVKQKHELTEAEISQLGRSVALIHVYKDGAYIGQGSGFVINTETFGKVLVSNCHVGCVGNELKITLDGQEYDYTGLPLFANETTDVYGIKIDTDVPGLSYTTEFPEVNDSVTAIGYPKENYSVSNGSVYSVDEVATRNITFTAKINPGSSGGLLLNSVGKAIGITTIGTPNYGGLIIAQAMPLIHVQDELDKLQ